MHRYEVIVDGDTLDAHEFKAQPQAGEVIEFLNGAVATIEHIRHNFRTGKLQAWCTKHTPKKTTGKVNQEKQPAE